MNEKVFRSFEIERRLVLRTEQDFEIAKEMEGFFNLRDECPFDLNTYDMNNSKHPSSQSLETLKSMYCPSIADYLFCFPVTPVNQTAYLKCPFKHTSIESTKCKLIF